MKNLNLTTPHLLLRLEGLAILIAGISLYTLTEGTWLTFFLLLLAPDAAMLGYLVNPKVGSWLYNLAHIYVLPVGLAVFSVLLASGIGLQISLIWVAHIGMDRVFGYGLKYEDQFKHTHFSKI
jgi:hypothetical protein